MSEVNDFPSNSNRQNKPFESTQSSEKKIQPVVSKPVQQVHRRPTFFEAVFDTKGKPLKDFFLEDLLYPNLRRATSTILHGMVTRIFGGGGGSGPINYSDRYVYSSTWADDRYSDYQSISSSRRKEIGSGLKLSKPNLMRFDSFVFPDKEECEKVLAVLDEQIDIYGWVSVSAFYEAINVTADHTFYNYGWDNLASAKIRSVDNGYIVDLPKPKPIR